MAFLKLYDPKNSATYTYPSIELFGTQAFIGKLSISVLNRFLILGNNVYGVKLRNGTNELISFDTAVMPFYLVATYENTDIMIDWQHAAIALFEQPQYSKLLKVCNFLAFSNKNNCLCNFPRIINF
jgi:hypothetical protein